MAGRELPDRHHHRVVPRRDLGADADRLAPDVRGVVAQVLAGRLALQHPGRAGEEAQLVQQRAPSPRCRVSLDRLAGVAALGRDDLVGPRLDRVGDAQQRPLPLGRRGVPPVLEAGLGGGAIAASTSPRRGDRRLRVGLAGARVDHRGRRPRPRCRRSDPPTKLRSTGRAVRHGDLPVVCGDAHRMRGLCHSAESRDKGIRSNLPSLKRNPNLRWPFEHTQSGVSAARSSRRRRSAPRPGSARPSRDLVRA